ncbi:DoxX family membrane protein [Pusillimonas sp. TS35]|uniref:DoxX family protein n=1 Tax=Paracandidimonas lactea TaxID=2895524 RepID=UPI0013698BCA|nr:DoxX family protein [Paracandidimonas lactea]MYN13274.1 DoxX family membrane protein [Pusillimonas sp. TS35]
MSGNTQDDLGKLLLRLTVGILFLFHGFAKLTKGVSGIESMVVANGLPAFVAWGVYLGEVIGPILVILGFYTRLGALLIAINMLFAVALAHTGHLAEFTANGGWRLELQALFLFGALAISLMGAGRFSLGGQGGRWN